MRRPTQILIALGIAAALAGGGTALAETSSASPTAAPSPHSASVQQPAESATVTAISTTVGGNSEQILVDAQGLPLYTYNHDTATQSQVSGSLAQLWPPLVSGSPTEAGTTGKLTVLSDANGQQVQYNGHFLYTFVDDTPGHVTGQGVQGFEVATPSLGTTSRPAGPAPAPVRSNPYGY